MINRQILEKRVELLQTGSVQLTSKLQKLQEEIEQTKANLLATNGAIQENLNWLKEFPIEVNDLKEMLGAESLEIIEGN